VFKSNDLSGVAIRPLMSSKSCTAAGKFFPVCGVSWGDIIGVSSGMCQAGVSK
jgi:hypothetical protein